MLLGKERGDRGGQLFRGKINERKGVQDPLAIVPSAEGRHPKNAARVANDGHTVAQVSGKLAVTKHFFELVRHAAKAIRITLFARAHEKPTVYFSRCQHSLCR